MIRLMTLNWGMDPPEPSDQGIDMFVRDSNCRIIDYYGNLRTRI